MIASSGGFILLSNPCLRFHLSLLQAQTYMFASSDGFRVQGQGGRNNEGDDGTVRVFRQKFTLEEAIGSHTCSLHLLA
jgi:hypothetical protein